MIKMETYDGVASLFLDEANKMLERGYYFLPLPYDWALTGWQERRKNFPIHDLIPAGTLRRYLRIVARENKRPFIRIRRQWHCNYVGHGNGDWGYGNSYTRTFLGYRILIPPRLYLAPLVHPIVLAGFTPGAYRTIHDYTLDEEFFSTYIKMFEEREEFRAALRLPPKVTPMKQAA